MNDVDVHVDPAPAAGPPRASRTWVVVIVFALVAVVGGTAAALVASRTSGDAAPEGDTVAGIVLETLDGSGTIDLASFDRPLVVNFWASWCTFCIAEMPDFESVHQQVGDSVVFVGIDVQDTRDLGTTFAERTGVSYLLAFDQPGTSLERLGGLGMPTTVFVDESGVILERHTGPLDAAELTDKLAGHFDV